MTARVLVVAYGALGLAVALVLRDLIETFRLGYTIFASGLILPTLVAFAPRLALKPRFAAAAMILGGSAAVAARFWMLAAVAARLDSGQARAWTV